MVGRRTGPLTQQELFDVWASVTDDRYSRPLIENPDSGIEAVEQAHAQFERASTMVDRSTQAMFILAHSSQTDDPASGERYARATLTVTRTKEFTHAITFAAGDVVVLHVADDFSKDGSIEVETGRKYLVEQDLTFVPGEAGPKELLVVAERPGYGYNLPFPGTLRRIEQLGVGHSNINASVVPGIGTHHLIVKPNPDVVTPAHVGQQVVFETGSNAGKVRRVAGYIGPGASDGGTAVLASTVILVVSGVVGSFTLNEEIEEATTLARGRFKAFGTERMVLEVISGTFAGGGLAITGIASGSVAICETVEDDGYLVAETETASWKIADYSVDLGFVVTNEESPEGGKSPMLDELGEERNIPRAPGEEDAEYRKRVATPADTISPGAVKRAANRVLAPIGSAVCFREVGDIPGLFPGVFFDAPMVGQNIGYGYDMVNTISTSFPFPGYIQDEVVTQAGGYRARAAGALVGGVFVLGTLITIEGEYDPTQPVVGETSGTSTLIGAAVYLASPYHRFQLAMDYTEFRAFFLLGVPPPTLGDFGIPFDALAATNAFDAFPYYAFFDGFPVTSHVLYRSIWQEVMKIKAGGVGFDLYIERLGCF